MFLVQIVQDQGDLLDQSLFLLVAIAGKSAQLALIPSDREQILKVPQVPDVLTETPSRQHNLAVHILDAFDLVGNHDQVCEQVEQGVLDFVIVCQDVHYLFADELPPGVDQGHREVALQFRNLQVV